MCKIVSFEKLDAFLTAPIEETIFDYFFNFLPYFANQFSPLFVFISVIFFTSKMAGNSEIIAILSSGVSFRRLLIPYMIGATVIAGLTFWLSNYAIPPTNTDRINYTNKYVKNKRIDIGSNIQLQVMPGVVAYMSRYDAPSKIGYRFSLDKFEGKTLVSRMTAQSISYDTLYSWTVRDYMIRNFDGMKETIKRGARLDTIIPIEPRDFLISKNDHETLTTPQLTEYIDKQKMRGVANIKSFEIEKERRYVWILNKPRSFSVIRNSMKCTCVFPKAIWPELWPVLCGLIHLCYSLKSLLANYVFSLFCIKYSV